MTPTRPTHSQPASQPRNSQEHGRDLRTAGASESPPPPWSGDEASEPRRRSSSDATPRPTPAPHPKTLAAVTALHDINANVLRAPASSSDFFGSSARILNLFGDSKPSLPHSSLQQQLRAPPQLLSLRTHSRAESALTLSSPLPSTVASGGLTAPKMHASPSGGKVPPGRTYDAKVVTREMHRLGNLPHLSSALGPALSTAASASSLTLTTQGSNTLASITTGASGESAWDTLHVLVLPLFVGEPLRRPIEDLNTLMKMHIQMTVSQSPSKALIKLENDVSQLITSGMMTLNTKFFRVDDDKLLGRVVEVWGFFWDQVLPYVEGVLLPLQTDPILSSLYRTPKIHRTTSPARQNGISSMSALNSMPHSSHIDVRTVALRSFRDNVILPLFPRLRARVSSPNRQDSFSESLAYQQPRLQQMLLVLASQGRRRPMLSNLRTPVPELTPGEAATMDLLHAVRSPQPQSLLLGLSKPSSRTGMSRMPSFLSGGLPRDRRGRVAQKSRRRHGVIGEDDEESDGAGDGVATPRNGYSNRTLSDAERDREKEREFLNSLRSPDVETNATQNSWGLTVGEDQGRVLEEDGEDDFAGPDQTVLVDTVRRAAAVV